LEEIGFDDFLTYWKSILKRNQTTLTKIIDNTKKINSNLKFGITLYEDQIPYLKEGTVYHLNDHNSKGINYVHLYLHHRNTSIETDVATVKTLFPNAKIIAGSYAYDSPGTICTKSNNKTCTDTEQLHYFNDSIRRQANLMKSGVIDAIEFWPAYFGNEDSSSFIAYLER
jgi:hypothetical protein